MACDTCFHHYPSRSIFCRKISLQVWNVMFDKSILYLGKTTISRRASTVEGSTSLCCIEGVPVEDCLPGLLAPQIIWRRGEDLTVRIEVTMGQEQSQRTKEVWLYDHAHGLYCRMQKHFEHVSTFAKKYKFQREIRQHFDYKLNYTPLKKITIYSKIFNCQQKYKQMGIFQLTNKYK